MSEKCRKIFAIATINENLTIFNGPVTKVENIKVDRRKKILSLTQLLRG